MRYRKVRVTESFPPGFFDGLAQPPLVMRREDRLTVDDAMSKQWPAFSLVTNEKGERGWVPTRYLRQQGKAAVGVKGYDTTTLSPGVGEILEVIEEDVESGWLWCRDGRKNLGWFALDHIEWVR